VIGEAVDLDHETLRVPKEIDFVLPDVGVHGGRGKVRGAQQREQAGLCL
jgi:hypothetical protein